MSTVGIEITDAEKSGSGGTPLIPALGKQRQVDLRVQSQLALEELCLEKNRKDTGEPKTKDGDFCEKAQSSTCSLLMIVSKVLERCGKE